MKIVIGIDPGEYTGYALSIDGKLVKLETLTFWQAIKELEREGVKMFKEYAYRHEMIHQAKKVTGEPLTMRVYIEDPEQNKTTFLVKNGTHRPNDVRRLMKISRDVGRNSQDARRLIEYAESQGLEVIKIRPNGRSLSKANAETFQMYYPYWTKRTNQHERDAALMIFGR